MTARLRRRLPSAPDWTIPASGPCTLTWPSGAASTEGIIPAIESAHAVAALRKLSFRPDDVVVLTVSGRGDKDVQTYLAHKDMAGEYGQF